MLSPEEISGLRKCEIAGAAFPSDPQCFQSLQRTGWDFFAEPKAISVATFYIGPESKTESRK